MNKKIGFYYMLLKGFAILLTAIIATELLRHFEKPTPIFVARVESKHIVTWHKDSIVYYSMLVSYDSTNFKKETIIFIPYKSFFEEFKIGDSIIFNLEKTILLKKENYEINAVGVKSNSFKK